MQRRIVASGGGPRRGHRSLDGSRPNRAQSGQWRSVGGDPAFTRYSPLDQITREQRQDAEDCLAAAGGRPELKTAFPDCASSGNYRSTPIVVDGVLYAPNARRPRPRVRRRDRQDAVGAGAVRADHRRSRGAEPARRRLLDRAAPMTGCSLMRGEYLYALNAEDRQAPSGLRRPRPRRPAVRADPLAGLFTWTAARSSSATSSIVAGDAARGRRRRREAKRAPEDIRGYDVRTGKLLWTFHVVPPAGRVRQRHLGQRVVEVLPATSASGAALSGDEELGYVYVPLTAPTDVVLRRPAARRQPLLRTPRRARREDRQAGLALPDGPPRPLGLRHVGPPMLGDITVNGRRIKAVMQPSKTGFLYVFDRATGTPVWPIEERPVPQSTVPGRTDLRRRSRSRPSRRPSTGRA